MNSQELFDFLKIFDDDLFLKIMPDLDLNYSEKMFVLQLLQKIEILMLRLSALQLKNILMFNIREKS